LCQARFWISAAPDQSAAASNPIPWFADFAKRLLGAVGIDPVRANGKRDAYYRCDACDAHALVMIAAADGAPNWLSRRPL